MAASGENPHGEVDLVCSYRPASVLDAGCGTGRVAIELVRRGIASVGVDSDPDMIAAARTKAPDISWQVVNLAQLDLGRVFDVVVMAGNVIVFAQEADRAAVIERCVAHLAPTGVLIAGFQLRPSGPTLDQYDRWCEAAGATLVERYAGWDGQQFDDGDYAVSIHARPGP